MSPALDIEPGQTVLMEDGAPGLVWQRHVMPSGVVQFTFLTPVKGRVVAWIVQPDALVPVAPLARVA